jgi:CheY-like chemotaxis protein
MKRKTTSRRAAAPSTSPPSTAPAARTLRVLVLDDDQDMCDMFALILCVDEGFDIVTCADVASCVEHLRAASAPAAAHPFDVLLLDLLLNDGRRGTEVLDAMHADPSLRLPPVAVCTALWGEQLSEHLPALDAGGIRLIYKPFDVDDLITELRTMAQTASQL